MASGSFFRVFDLVSDASPHRRLGRVAQPSQGLLGLGFRV